MPLALSWLRLKRKAKINHPVAPPQNGALALLKREKFDLCRTIL
jgi:hypothetical protein